MKISAVMLAAGNSQRFNGIKQLVEINGAPMVAHSIASLTGNGALIPHFNQFTVILGAHAEKIMPVLPGYVSASVCMQWQQGMGASLSFAIGLLTAEPSHLLVTLADQINITHQDIETMLRRCGAQQDKIIAAAYNQVIGAPVIFPRRYFPELMELQADVGAKKLLQQYSGEVVMVDMPAAMHDIDTRVELARCQQSFDID